MRTIWNRKTPWAAGLLLALAACPQANQAPTEGGEVRAGTAGNGCTGPACGGEPVTADVPASCAATTCPVNHYCDEISGQAQCIPLPSCDTQQCPEGQHCELVQVQCIRAPCPPQPTCQPNAT